MNRGDDDKFTGVYVKDPKSGKYNWVFDLDLTSMYPSRYYVVEYFTEMKIGKVNGWDHEEFIRGVSKTYSLEKNGKTQGHMNNEELNKCLNQTKYPYLQMVFCIVMIKKV